jgi:hypothetical protein
MLCVQVFAGDYRVETEAEEIAAVQAHYRALGVPSPEPGELGRPFRPHRLNLPTMMSRIGKYWFIIDSYNNRVLYSARLDGDLDNWRLLDGRLSRPHSIAGDGEFLVLDDTEAHAIRVYRDNGGGFSRHQVFIDAGARPHRVWYEPADARFYALAANSQELLVMRAKGEKLEIVARDQLPSIRGMYTRSFRVIDHRLWLFTAHGVVSVVDHHAPGYPEVARYTVPADLAGINDMVRAGDAGGPWYLSATRNLLAQCRLIERGSEGRFDCQDLKPRVEFRGNPYLFHRYEDAMYLGVVAGRDTVLRIDLSQQGEVRGVEDLFPR